MSTITTLITTIQIILLPPQRDRDQRGLSQSTENAILLAGAVVIAGIIIAVITTFVTNNLPS